MKPCFDYALAHCSRFPKTERDLTRFLLKKWYEEETVSETMSRLKKLWFVNDETYVDLYFSSEVIRKGRPLFLIKQKLQQKWVDRSLIDSFISENEEDLEAWMRTAIKKEYERLQSRDFSSETIVKKLVQKWYPYGLVLSCSAE